MDPEEFTPVRMTDQIEDTIVDLDGVTRATEDLLRALGEDPQRPGLSRTPERVARMYTELLEGYARIRSPW
jgi:GTP cyclohydrolase I